MQVARRLSTVIIWIIAIIFMIFAMDAGSTKGVIIIALIALGLTYAFNWVFADKD